MSTIQIRNVPDEVHRVYRQRAAAAGMSLQEYLREELVRHAYAQTPAEVVAAVERRLDTEGSEGFAARSSAAVMRADRDAH